MGNMWVPSASGIPADPLTPASSSWFNLQTNRLDNPGASVGYDASGNLASIGGFGWSYDAENRLASSTIDGVTTIYAYDGDGRRVSKTQGGTTTVYVYDAAGQLAAEYSGSPQTTPCITCYLTSGHLGSTRAVTDEAGAVKSRHDYLPFGEEIPSGIGGRTSLAINDGAAQKFTGKERDSETGLDWFSMRYLSSAQGRFTSPDPLLASGGVGEPQTWNRYTYVSNNPLKYTDPTGEGIFGTIFGILAGVFTLNPWIGLAASAAGNGLDAAFWGPQAAGKPGTPFNLGSLTSCGGRLGTCGSLGAGPWSEITGLGNVKDPGRFIFTFEDKSKSKLDWWSALKHSPWLVSWILPLWPLPAAAGVGPAGSIAWNPATKTLCASIGTGASVGDNLAASPVTGRTLNGKQATPSQINQVFRGWSANFGFNVPTGPVPLGPGVQGSANGSGVVYGPTVGVAGASVSSTYAFCASF